MHSQGSARKMEAIPGIPWRKEFLLFFIFIFSPLLRCNWNTKLELKCLDLKCQNTCSFELCMLTMKSISVISQSLHLCMCVCLCWLSWGLVVACELLVVAWDLVPWLEIEPGPLHWECSVLATGPPGKSPQSLSAHLSVFLLALPSPFPAPR